MDLQVAAVDPVVVGDDQLGQLDVLVLDRLEGPVERLELTRSRPSSARLLERLELLLVVHAASASGHQPTFPLT